MSHDRLAAEHPTHLFDLVIGRHKVFSFVMIISHLVKEWLSLFDDSTLGNRALGRLANASYQIVIEGASYRDRLSAH